MLFLADHDCGSCGAQLFAQLASLVPWVRGCSYRRWDLGLTGLWTFLPLPIDAVAVYSKVAERVGGSDASSDLVVCVTAVAEGRHRNHRSWNPGGSKGFKVNSDTPSTAQNTYHSSSRVITNTNSTQRSIADYYSRADRLAWRRRG